MFFAIYVLAAFLFGMTLGERGELGFVQAIFGAVIPIATVVMALVARRGRASVIVTGVAMLSGLLLGQYQFARAWDDCVMRAESVRMALLAREGDYPSRLEELGVELPCGCGFRRTILHYLANDRAFRLWYTNDRETVVLSSSGRS